MRTLPPPLYALGLVLGVVTASACGPLHGRSGLLYTARAAPIRPLPASGDVGDAGASQTGQTTDASAITSEAELNAATGSANAAAARSTASDNTGSVVSIGSLIGLSVPLYTPDTWFVRDRIVRLQRAAQAEDYLIPGVYLLPSVSLIGAAGHSLSVIFPAGLDSRRNVSAGVGVSWGFGVRRGTEVGLSLAVIWSPAPRLSDEQQHSLDTAMALPVGASETIETSLRPILGLGIYITPQF